MTLANLNRTQVATLYSRVSNRTHETSLSVDYRKRLIRLQRRLGAAFMTRENVS